MKTISSDLAYLKNDFSCKTLIFTAYRHQESETFASPSVFMYSYPTDQPGEQESKQKLKLSRNIPSGITVGMIYRNRWGITKLDTGWFFGADRSENLIGGSQTSKGRSVLTVVTLLGRRNGGFCGGSVV